MWRFCKAEREGEADGKAEDSPLKEELLFILEPDSHARFSLQEILRDPNRLYAPLQHDRDPLEIIFDERDRTATVFLGDWYYIWSDIHAGDSCEVFLCLLKPRKSDNKLQTDF